MNKKINDELKKISAKHKGILLPKDVVDEARDKKSILHNCFEWDNNKAAETYRLWQARQLISVCVEYSVTTKKTYDVFVSLTPDRKRGGYREMTNVLSNETLTEILLKDALNEMNLFMRKYQSLIELKNVFDEMTIVIKKHNK